MSIQTEGKVRTKAVLRAQYTLLFVNGKKKQQVGRCMYQSGCVRNFCCAFDCVLAHAFLITLSIIPSFVTEANLLWGVFLHSTTV